VRFSVDALDEKGNPIPEGECLSIECKGPEDVAPIVSLENCQISVFFETNIRKGLFHIGIQHKGKHIHRSPFEVSVSPSEEEHLREYDDVPVASLPAVSRLIQFSVKAKTKDLADISAKDCIGEVVFGEDGKPDVKIDNYGPHEFLVGFYACKAGKHKISVQKGGEDILGSPFRIDVPAEAIYGAS